MSYNPTPLPAMDPERFAAVDPEWERRLDEGLAKLLADNMNMQFGPAGSYGFLHWQVGPHSAGRNGVEVADVLDALIERVELLQAVSACRENSLIITHLEEALFWVRRRRELRDEQGARGGNLQHSSHGQGLYTNPERWGFEFPSFPNPLTTPDDTPVGATSDNPEGPAPDESPVLAESDMSMPRPQAEFFPETLEGIEGTDAAELLGLGEVNADGA